MTAYDPTRDRRKETRLIPSRRLKWQARLAIFLIRLTWKTLWWTVRFLWKNAKYLVDFPEEREERRSRSYDRRWRNTRR